MPDKFQFNLPEFLDNPERLKKEAEHQQELREAMNVRGRHSPAEQARMFAMRKEDTARNALKDADWETAAFQRDHLAEALIEQGRFAEAAHAAHGDHWKAEAVRLHNAMERDDDENCECPDLDLNTKIPHRNIERVVWSERHQAYMPVVVCNLCGETNIRPQPDDMRSVAEKRAKANTLAGRRKFQNKDDVQALRKRLTDAGLGDDKVR